MSFGTGSALAEAEQASIDAVKQLWEAQQKALLASASRVSASYACGLPSFKGFSDSYRRSPTGQGIRKTGSRLDN